MSIEQLQSTRSFGAYESRVLNIMFDIMDFILYIRLITQFHWLVTAVDEAIHHE